MSVSVKRKTLQLNVSWNCCCLFFCFSSSSDLTFVLSIFPFSNNWNTFHLLCSVFSVHWCVLYMYNVYVLCVGRDAWVNIHSSNSIRRIQSFRVHIAHHVKILFVLLLNDLNAFSFIKAIHARIPQTLAHLWKLFC